MELNREVWERVIEQSEAMLKDALLTKVNATLMIDNAKKELAKLPKEDKKKPIGVN